MTDPTPKNTIVTLSIDWMSFDYDPLTDLDPPPDPDEGWYVTVDAPDGSGGYVGPDHYGPGFQTLDAALVACKKWAEDRGFTYQPPIIELTAVRSV